MQGRKLPLRHDALLVFPFTKSRCAAVPRRILFPKMPVMVFVLCA